MGIPLLITYVSIFIKDAAKAVKRITLQDFIHVADDTLSKWLGIATMIINSYFFNKEGEYEVLHIWCSHRENVALCSHCNTLSTTIHQEKHRCIRHLDMWGKKTFLHFLSRRFQCDHCGRTFNEELPFVDAHRRQSIAFEKHIYKLCQGSTFKKVAFCEGLSNSTVIDIFNYYAAIKHTISNNFRATRVLGIDELSLKKRHQQYVLVISDIDRKCVLTILPNREKKTLEKWIESLNEQERKAIRWVSIDMWAPYYQAARSKLPHAKVVVDRFHVMKQLNTRLTQLRSKYQKESTIEIQDILKGSRWILVRNRHELSKEDAEKLNIILGKCPELRICYLLKEEFRAIFEKIQSKEKAARFLDAWMFKVMHSGDKYLAKFVKTLRNWRDQILNYFIERITNGFVEGLNNGLRIIIRMACGYRNFNNFKLRAFSQFGAFHANPD